CSSDLDLLDLGQSPQEPGASDDTIVNPVRLDSVTMRFRACSLRGLTQIQKVTLSPGDAWVRLTNIEAATGRSPSPAASGTAATRTKANARRSGIHNGNR